MSSESTSDMKRMETLLPDHPRAHLLSGMALIRWSPRIWGALHGLSYLYPSVDLSPLIVVLSKTMPCMSCAYHVAQYMDSHPTPANDHEPFDWFRYLVGLHNDVNQRSEKPVCVLSELLISYEHVQQQDPGQFRRSVHDRLWQTLWMVLGSYDVSGTYDDSRADVDELRALFLLAQELTGVATQSLPSYCPTTPWTVQWLHSLFREWSASSDPYEVPYPIEWWVDLVSSHRDLHNEAYDALRAHNDFTLAFLEDLLGTRWFLRVMPGPLDRTTWYFVETMTERREVLFHQPLPTTSEDTVDSATLYIVGTVVTVTLLVCVVIVCVRK
jgi:hypothetical protein